MGVRPVGAPLTGREAGEASLLQPDGPGGRALLVFDNFRATMKWNKSVPFAAAVGMIADGIDRG
jgi:membrane-bound lytic murein transglycosylase B